MRLASCLGQIHLGQPLFRRDLFDRYLGGTLPFYEYGWDWRMIEIFLRTGCNGNTLTGRHYFSAREVSCIHPKYDFATMNSCSARNSCSGPKGERDHRARSDRHRAMPGTGPWASQRGWTEKPIYVFTGLGDRRPPTRRRGHG